MTQAGGLRVRLLASDAVRRRGLIAMLEAAGHVVAEDAHDVTLCDLGQVVAEAEAPAVALGGSDSRTGSPAGVLSPDATAAQIDLALRAVAAGLLVRSPSAMAEDGFAPLVEDVPLLTPREREILALVGQGMSNKAVARHLGISVHTVKFHLEALFAKLNASSRAEAVAKGLVGGVIEL
ncbi:MAG: response regulator transcription factor [Acetobacteraceae bacterium]|nr:response regulator transcription factor [Pseudomonadota bacterium]